MSEREYNVHGSFLLVQEFNRLLEDTSRSFYMKSFLPERSKYTSLYMLHLPAIRDHSK